MIKPQHIKIEIFFNQGGILPTKDSGNNGIVKMITITNNPMTIRFFLLFCFIILKVLSTLNFYSTKYV